MLRLRGVTAVASASFLLVTPVAGCGSDRADQLRSSEPIPGSVLPIGKLAAAGITVSVPSGTPSITKQQALSEVSGVAEDIGLRHVAQPGRQPPLDTDAWVIPWTRVERGRQVHRAHLRLPRRSPSFSLTRTLGTSSRRSPGPKRNDIYLLARGRTRMIASSGSGSGACGRPVGAAGGGDALT